MNRFGKIDKIIIIGYTLLGVVLPFIDSPWWVLLIPAAAAYACVAWWMNGWKDKNVIAEK